jgi:iron complex transport system permease protein
MSFIEKKRYFIFLFTVSTTVLICLMVLSCTIGVADISFVEALKIMLSRVPLINRIFGIVIDDSTKQAVIKARIILTLRMPRALLASITGAGLSTVGASLQGIFKNPMAAPGILGISSGAAFGASVAITLGAAVPITAGMNSNAWGMGAVTIAAFIGAIITIFLVYGIARTKGRLPVGTLLLSGIAISFLMTSATQMNMVFNRNAVERIMMWMMGSVEGASWQQTGMLAVVVFLGMAVLMFFLRDLNVMVTGDETAASMGIEVEKVKKIILVISAVIVGSCVAVSGVIGFVGLVVPHMVRLVMGPDHRVVLPYSAIGGAVFMVVCDTAARNLIWLFTSQPSEIPVGIITSLLGAPFFIYLLIKNKRKVF